MKSCRALFSFWNTRFKHVDLLQFPLLIFKPTFVMCGIFVLTSSFGDDFNLIFIWFKKKKKWNCFGQTEACGVVPHVSRHVPEAIEGWKWSPNEEFALQRVITLLAWAQSDPISNVRTNKARKQQKSLQLTRANTFQSSEELTCFAACWTLWTFTANHCGPFWVWKKRVSQWVWVTAA